MKIHKPTSNSFKLANGVLLALIILVNGYIISAPFAPAVSFWWSEHTNHTSQKLQGQLLAPIKAPPHSTPAAATIPVQNRLIIPSMQLDTEIFEGSSLSTLNKGVWHRPISSTPEKGGNTVIAGHRFTYTNPKGIFYYLNKVQLGDKIGVWWHGTRYLYEVSTIEVVPPTEISIEDNTSGARLTLYTCTPLWSPNQRLVIIATLESKQ
jgi:LPXTG-site transpeptidase (sortase) family protein